MDSKSFGRALEVAGIGDHRVRNVIEQLTSGCQYSEIFKRLPLTASFDVRFWPAISRIYQIIAMWEPTEFHSWLEITSAHLCDEDASASDAYSLGSTIGSLQSCLLLSEQGYRCEPYIDLIFILLAKRMCGCKKRPVEFVSLESSNFTSELSHAIRQFCVMGGKHACFPGCVSKFSQYISMRGNEQNFDPLDTLLMNRLCHSALDLSESLTKKVGVLQSLFS